LNGLNSFAITKLDVLTGLKTLNICVGYELGGKRIDCRPASLKKQARCTPVYEEMLGWEEDITGSREKDQLPEQARAYLDSIEKITGVPVSIVSVGPGREETIMVQNPF